MPELAQRYDKVLMQKMGADWLLALRTFIEFWRGQIVLCQCPVCDEMSIDAHGLREIQE